MTAARAVEKALNANREVLMLFLSYLETTTRGLAKMEGPYTEIFKWCLIALVCVLPGIAAAAFGRGVFMVAAQSFHFLRS